MAKKRDEEKDVNEQKDIFRTEKESRGEMFGKTAELSMDAAPEKYKEFYDEWVKIYQNSFDKFYPLPTPESNRKTLETILSSTKESNKVYRSWIDELEKNSRKTKEILQGEPDQAKFKECSDMWIKSYEKIFDELMGLPEEENTKEIWKYMGIPDIYSESFLELSKLWKNSYKQLWMPLNKSMLKLSEKMAEISRGDAGSEAYKEFYALWMDTNKEIYGKYASSMEPTGEIFQEFAESSDIYLSMYKSWIAALEKMSEKAQELSREYSNPDGYKEFYDRWITTYEKAFDSFFDDMPTVGGPMKEIMESVKVMARMYTDTFTGMSKMWSISDIRSMSAYPGKHTT